MQIAVFQMLIFVLLDHNYISEKLLQKMTVSWKLDLLSVHCPLSASSRGLASHWPESDLLFWISQRGHSAAAL